MYLKQYIIVIVSGNARDQRRATGGPSAPPPTLTQSLRSLSTLCAIPPLWRRLGRHTRDRSKEESQGRVRKSCKTRCGFSRAEIDQHRASLSFLLSRIPFLILRANAVARCGSMGYRRELGLGKRMTAMVRGDIRFSCPPYSTTFIIVLLSSTHPPPSSAGIEARQQ